MKHNDEKEAQAAYAAWAKRNPEEAAAELKKIAAENEEAAMEERGNER